MDPKENNSTRKEIFEMSERELLMELVEDKRRAESRRRICYGVLIVLAVIIVFLLIRYLPSAIAYFKELNENLIKLQKTAEEVSRSYQELEQSIGNIDLGKLSIQDLIDLFTPR